MIWFWSKPSSFLINCHCATKRYPTQLLQSVLFCFLLLTSHVDYPPCLKKCQTSLDSSLGTWPIISFTLLTHMAKRWCLFLSSSARQCTTTKTESRGSFMCAHTRILAMAGVREWQLFCSARLEVWWQFQEHQLIKSSVWSSEYDTLFGHCNHTCCPQVLWVYIIHDLRLHVWLILHGKSKHPHAKCHYSIHNVLQN